MLNKIKILLAAAVLSVTVSANVQAATITVKTGDTLWDLSNENHTSVEAIQKVNHLATDLIHPGDKLTIAQEKHYIVKQDDTLKSIALEHKVSVSQLLEWNELLTKNLIYPGLDLVIYKNSKIPKQDNADKQKKPAPVKKEKAKETSDKKVITVRATAYTASCQGCSGTTATGVDLKANPDKKVIAVDPSVIPLGSKVYVEGFGNAVAADTGSAIKGNRIDIFIPSEKDAVKYGVKHVKVTILE
ncbi:LysM peptidoglycan-binding domain-containing protein [Neobacillus mesonae]|uniref:LysM peptidoglycan-binding domain-containing protein n=1 Tax=Neobacillus mesonae TaxID=1193713 RepID=UPI0020404874|nr:LysM peptidoglycan-binding domain-containing protein [Neobacillus mesonae]MCM3567084.1 LysM peptidoglycan-binding domain-containing protein [Neobacillus mesonae]